MAAANNNTARLAMVAAVVLCLLLATGPQEATGADGYLAYDKLISCKTLGNCDKNNQGAEATRPMQPVNNYTRGCSKIFQCRG